MTVPTLLALQTEKSIQVRAASETFLDQQIASKKKRTRPLLKKPRSNNMYQLTGSIMYQSKRSLDRKIILSGLQIMNYSIAAKIGLEECQLNIER